MRVPLSYWSRKYFSSVVLYKESGALFYFQDIINLKLIVLEYFVFEITKLDITNVTKFYI